MWLREEGMSIKKILKKHLYIWYMSSEPNNNLIETNTDNNEDCTSYECITNENNENNENNELVIAQAIPIVDETDTTQMQNAVPYYPERRIIDKELILNINQLTVLLAILNIPYLFTNLFFYILRVGFMVGYTYHAIF